MDVFIVGGDSAIGGAAARRLGADGMTVAATTRRRAEVSLARPFLDLAATPQSWDLPRADICILAAARARLTDCESDPQGSRLVNATATVELAQRMAEHGSLVVLLSTNQVFDGLRPARAPEDTPAPITAYGRQKAEAEAGIGALGDAGAILRLTKVLTDELPLVQDWLRHLAAGKQITGFSDMRLGPVLVDKVAEAIALICRRRAPGIFQASGDRDITYDSLARRVAAACGADPALVKAESGERAGLAAALRPRHTTLDTGSLAGLGWAPETSDRAIARYCTETLGLRAAP